MTKRRVEVHELESSDDLYGALLDDDVDALYERAPCGYLSTTPDGTIVKVNQTFLNLTGHQRDELVGRRRFTDLLTAGGRIYHETHYAPMLHMQGRAREIALDIVRADGARLPALVNAVLERDAGGAPVVIRTAVFDATERRGYERELVRAKKRAEESEAHARLLARTLQQTLIPPALPTIAGLEVAAAFRPAGTGEEIGGDFYDVFEISADEWVVALGDVQGKGVDAAVITGLVRHTIRAAAVRTPLPSQVLETVNEVLIRQHEADRFCTVVVMSLRRTGETWTATVSSGGHPLPLLHRPGIAPVTFGQSAMLLGIFDSATFADADVMLGDGDVIVLYTDGVTEGRCGDEWFGEARLNAIIESHADSAAAVADGVLAEVLDFQSGFTRDDIAVVAIRVPPRSD